MYQSLNYIVTNDLKLSCAKLAEVVYENHFQKLRGKEYYDLISLDFDKIINFSYSSSIEYLDSYISLLNSNISIIAENSDFISDFYKEKIFKLYSKFVKKQIGKYSEDNFNSLLKEDYDIKKMVLLKNRMGLWDVLKFCDRKSSLDVHIKNEICNDFSSFYSKYPSIKTIFFNGKNAMEYYKRNIGYSENLNFYTLPSTSPANSTKKYTEKLNEWYQVLERLS